MSPTPERLRAELVSLAEPTLARVAPEGTPLIAAVSGGADSMALAWTLAALADRWPLVGVVFIDHGLREVGREREAVVGLARRLEVPYFERRVAPAVGPGNLQANARRARYRALIEIARGLGETTMVATGHTASDQAETVLSRLLRGSGLPGLSGLSPRRGRIVRPLLAASRRMTRALGLDFVDDPSNASPRFERNRLRAVLESLGAEQPRLEAALATLAETARGATRLLDAAALAGGERSLVGLDEPTVTTLLVHLARARGARGVERRALAAWTRALTGGRSGAFSLGQGLRGTARDGRAGVVGDDDPRRMVVAWRPGTYRGTAMELTITAGVHGSHEGLAEGETVVHRDGVQWPLRLEVAGPREPGLGGDELDFVSGRSLGGWRVVDASGRTLVPGGAAAGIAAADGARTGRLGPAGAREDDWIRIVLMPLSRARET